MLLWLLIIDAGFIIDTFTGKYAGLSLVYLCGSFFITTSLEVLFWISQEFLQVSFMCWLMDVAIS